ncbi:hypothetical protein A1F94_009905 [Pyrenophora tritici-repentis]|nr:hypothetical protein A1F94_009905 [Pyrenophora tritici-repentis]PZC96412.1 hypothetical protein A1F95_05364 [Pyrenophora tritici-repentis]PZD34315.1 hypothetical protein A1F96_01568 [Pyrenophora tritici-repentis]
MAYLLLPSDTTTESVQETHTPQTIPIRFAGTTSGDMAYNYNPIEHSSEESETRRSGGIIYADLYEPYEVEAAVPTPLVWEKQARAPAAQALPSRPTEAHIRRSYSDTSPYRGARVQQHRGSGGVASSSTGRVTRQSQSLQARPQPLPHDEPTPQAPSLLTYHTPQNLDWHDTTRRPNPRPQLHLSHIPTRDYERPSYGPLCSPLTHNENFFDDTIFTPFTADSAVSLRPTRRRASDAGARQNRISLAPLEAQYMRRDIQGFRVLSTTLGRLKHMGRVVAEGFWKDRP